MPRNGSPHRRGRVHIVLIPGFAGFDALGQMEYYAGVTPQFHRWKKLPGRGRFDLDLHYFDNFPTAAVRTRAARLRNYLAKRIARGEFVAGDEIVLVGHSTGGLDIRWLLWKLNESPDQKLALDGATGNDFMVPAKEILHLIKRVVFLSVPQLGTNIADWVRSHAIGRDLVVADLRASVTASQAPVVDTLQQRILDYAAKGSRLGVALAIRDAMSEAEADAGGDPMCVASAQEAASELQLWLRHIATNFHAIDDLALGNAHGDPESPAHFNDEMREEEKTAWKRHGIATRSYATVGARPFAFSPGRPAELWDLLKPSTYPEFTPRQHPAPHTDFVYRGIYRACAGGPFTLRDNQPIPEPFLVADNSPLEPESWDNDGIVNTASMLWPNKEHTLLVSADHMDIVGHYAPVHAAPECHRRKYQAYDLFKSGSGFDDAGFAKVWNDIFDYCVSG
ncbi:MAG TPA: hypothetical protein VL240_06160 [Candidatus Binatia bacterium]|nr:hypothetical protein [Candidatus Binatia bacterium]